jgi:hypothetical protein
MLYQRAESENKQRKEVSKMKKAISLLCNLLLSTTLFWAVPAAADELVEKEDASLANYCHMKFPPMRENTLSWDHPELNTDAEKSIDFYGPCDHDPTGADEIKTQKAMQRRETDDGSND